MKTLEALRTLDHIMHVDDERELGNSFIVTLAEGWFFADEPDCGVQGFDTVTDARRGCSRKKVVYDPELYARLNAAPVPVIAQQPQSVVDAAEVAAYEAAHARIVSGEISSTSAVFGLGWRAALAASSMAAAPGWPVQSPAGGARSATAMPIGYANPKHLARMAEGSMGSLSVVAELSPDELHTAPVYSEPLPLPLQAERSAGVTLDVLAPFLAVVDAYDPAEDDTWEPWKDGPVDPDLRLTLGHFRALRAAVSEGGHLPLEEIRRLQAENAALREDKARLDRGYIMTGVPGGSGCEHRGLDLRASIDRVTQLDGIRAQRAGNDVATPIKSEGPDHE